MLRSVNEIRGYTLAATDGDLGRSSDFLFDDRMWVVRYMVADTRKWLPGRKVLVGPDWVSDLRWTRRRLRVDLTREGVESSPEFDPQAPINREYEERLYDFYGRPRYWGR